MTPFLRSDLEVPFSMQIQINAPNVEVPAAFAEFIEHRISEVLSPFTQQLTRVEVHLQDQNGQKSGPDKRCMLEARPRNLDPIAVEVIATEQGDAVRQAVEKLKHALEHRLGRLSSRRREV